VIESLPVGHPDRILIEGYEMAMSFGAPVGEVEDLARLAAEARERLEKEHKTL
jgi:hypothetical protein